MKYGITLLFFSILVHVNSGISAQVTPASDTNQVLETTDIMPEFPGGEDSLNQYFVNHIKVPSKYERNGPVGASVVKVFFIVNKTGKVVQAKVTQSVGWGCDEEALRVVRNMPMWKPGIQKGKPVNVSFSLPITFYLEP